MVYIGRKIKKPLGKKVKPILIEYKIKVGSLLSREFSGAGKFYRSTASFQDVVKDALEKMPVYRREERILDRIAKETADIYKITVEGKGMSQAHMIAPYLEGSCLKPFTVNKNKSGGSEGW